MSEQYSFVSKNFLGKVTGMYYGLKSNGFSVMQFYKLKTSTKPQSLHVASVILRNAITLLYLKV